MDTLAPELLDAVIDELGSADLARFMASRPFSSNSEDQVERVLFATAERCNSALRWACANGNHDLIRRAVAHGFSVNDVPSTTSPPIRVLTLYLAAKHGQRDTFALLLDLGASIHVPGRESVLGLGRQVSKLMKWLSSPPNLGLLQLFLDRGLDSQVRGLHSSTVTWPLAAAIRSGASPALVQTLLAHGAGPDMLLSNSGHALQSPLSAAILAGSHEVAEVLIARGASIDGRRLALPGHHPTHLPMFAAVARLAATPGQSGQDMVRLCLQSGGNINQHAYYTTRDDSSSYWTTPLLVFLNSVPAWTKSADDDGNPQDGLEYLLAQGAAGSSRKEPLTEHPSLGRPNRRLTLISEAPTGVDVLIERWGIDELARSDLAAAVGTLIRRGVLNDSEMRQMLSRCCRHLDVKSAQPAPVLTAWGKLLDLMVARARAQAPNGATSLLLTVVDDFGTGDVIRSKTRNLLTATIHHLVAAHGADINARACEGQVTVLHHLCRYYRRIATDGNQAWDTYRLSATSIVDGRCDLLSALLKTGADHTVVFQGKTALDELSSGLEKDTLYGKPFLQALIKVFDEFKKE